MKGMMVALLTLVVAGNAIAQESNQGEELKFGLKLTDQLIEDLKTNPDGLIAPVPEHLRRFVTHVVIEYVPPEAEQIGGGGGNGPVSNADFETTSRQNGGFGSQPNSDGTRNSRLFRQPQLDSSTQNGSGFQGINPRFDANNGTQSPIGQRNRTIGNVPAREVEEWIPFGDNTDFVPVTRRNVRGFDSRQPMTQQANNDFNSGRRNQIDLTPPARIGDNRDNSFAGMNPDRMPNNGNGANDTMRIPRRDLVNLDPWNKQQAFGQQLPQLDQQSQARIAQQQRTIDDQTRRLAQMEEQIRRLQQQPSGRTGESVAMNSNQYTQEPTGRQQVNYGPTTPFLERSVIQNPSNRQPNRHANDFYTDTLDSNQMLDVASMPNRRRRSLNTNRPVENKTALPTVQIPGPDSQDSVADASSLENGTGVTKTQIVAQNDSLRKANGFLLFMLIVSIGINIYLGLIARSFYTRYGELADELRETFTATM